MILVHRSNQEPAWRVAQVEAPEPSELWARVQNLLQVHARAGYTLRSLSTYNVARPESPLLQGIPLAGNNRDRVQGRQTLIMHLGVSLILELVDPDRYAKGGQAALQECEGANGVPVPS